MLLKILKGTLTETRFAIPTNPGLDGPLLRTSQKNFHRDQVTYMSDSVCHPSMYPFKSSPLMLFVAWPS
jgi:hypothetical protein